MSEVPRFRYELVSPLAVPRLAVCPGEGEQDPDSPLGEGRAIRLQGPVQRRDGNVRLPEAGSHLTLRADDLRLVERKDRRPGLASRQRPAV